MTLVIGVVCEAAADQRTACGIADRITCEEIDWIEPSVLEAYRTWRGPEDNTLFLAWKQVRSTAQRFQIRAHGHFEGEPGAPDAAAGRRAIRVMRAIQSPVDALVLVRDSDGNEERRTGLGQARQHSAFRDRVVIGVAHPKREAWVLCGFQPKDKAERTTLEHVAREIGFDPVCGSHRLGAKQDRAKKSAKRVLKQLCPSPERECVCWQETDLDILSRRGQQNGLAEFMEEVKDRLVPLFREAPSLPPA